MVAEIKFRVKWSMMDVEVVPVMAVGARSGHCLLI